MDTSQKNWPLIAFFCGFLAIISILFLCFPPKSVSPVEKRTLEPFPSVSASAIANGRFEAGMDRYVSDHIPAAPCGLAPIPIFACHRPEWLEWHLRGERRLSASRADISRL